jgi:YVTN family beta-propeller protein
MGIASDSLPFPLASSSPNLKQVIKLRPNLLLLMLPSLAGCHRSDFPTLPTTFREFAYVANSASNTVTVIDLVYLRIDRTLRVGDNPTEIALSPTRREAYVLNTQSSTQNGSVSVVDTSANQVVATMPVHRAPVAISVDPSGHRAFVANSGSNTISVLDLDTRRAVAAIPTSQNPASALIAPDGRTLLVTFPSSGTIGLFAAASADPKVSAPNSPLLQIRSTFDRCPGATSPVILPDSSKAYIACPGSNQVLALSLAADPTTWAARQDSSLLSDHALTLLNVGTAPTYLTMKPDGGEVFVSNTASGSISEISTQTNEVGSTFGIGEKPTFGVVSSDNSVLWVSNSGADSISLYSIDDGKRLPSIRIGSTPGELAFTTDRTAKEAQRFLLVASRQSGNLTVIRTNSREGPGLFTIFPAGAGPGAVAVQSNNPSH